MTKFITGSLLFVILLLAGNPSSAQNITLSKRNATLENIFFEISRQSGFQFSYDQIQITHAEKVTIDVKSMPLADVLERISRNQAFTFQINGNTVALVSKPLTHPVGIAISGKITDADGMPIPGSNILVKGTTRGTTADENGDFNLTVLDPDVTLEITHIGYEKKEIALDNQTQLRIMLETGTRILDEVITNGYRSTTRRENLGTSTKINAEEISRQPINNPLAALQARVPGMIVTQRGGLPGAGFAIQIRGQRSIGYTTGIRPYNSPLFIVDGIPFLSNSESMTQRSLIIANSPFNTINPADIESIEVLRDANALSIYGSLGANGVVLITTKKAKPGKTSVSVNLYSGIGNVTRYADYMNTTEYVRMRNEAFANDGQTPNFGNAPDLVLWDTTRYTNWKEMLIGGTAHINNAHITMSTGTEHTQVSLGVGLNKETTVYPGSSGKTLNSMNLNVRHTISRFEIMLSSSYGYDKSNLLSNDLTIGVITPPNAPPPYDAAGKLNFRENGYPNQNPFSYLYQPYTVIMERVSADLKLNYKITPWLNLRTNTGYMAIQGDETLLLPIASQDPGFMPTGKASFGTSVNKSWIAEPQVEFAHSLGKHGKIKALAGFSMRERTGKSDLQNGDGYTNDAALNSISGAATVTAEQDFRQYRVISSYGLVNYNLKGKYLLESTIRRDGSSRFGPNKRFANFTSIAAGWIFSDEVLIRKAIPLLSFGKLRTNYGTLGNDQIGDYAFLDTWRTSVFSYQGPVITPERLANNNYKWELVRSFDVGMDLGLFSNRILLAVTWNQSRTSDQLVALRLPAQAGFNIVARNYPAVVRNRNLEIELNTVNIRRKNFKWSSSFNFTVQRNVLEKFPDIDTTTYGLRKFLVGESLNLAWGYRSAGVDPATGIYRFYDRKGNLIPASASPVLADQVHLGNYDPSYFGGIQNSIEYGNWQLHFLVQFVKQMGHHSFYTARVPPGSVLFNQPVYALNRWQQPNDQAPYQRYVQSPSNPASIAGIVNTESSAAVYTDASFIRLKNISLSWSFPSKWMEKIRAKNCMLYFQAQNMITITKYLGNDPESYASPLALPPLKVFTAGIQATF